MDFTGAGVTVPTGNGKTTINIPGGGGGGGNFDDIGTGTNTSCCHDGWQRGITQHFGNRHDHPAVHASGHDCSD